jgi:hypothetical protein
MKMSDSTKKTGFARAAAGSFVAAVIAGLHWPRFFPQVFLIGLFLGRPLFDDKKRRRLFWAYIAAVIIHHFRYENLTYPFMWAANPAYFITALILAAASYALCVKGKPLWVFYILLAAVLPGQLLTDYGKPALILALVLFIPLASYSGEPRRTGAAAAAVAVAVFHCFFIFGLSSYSGWDFTMPGERSWKWVDSLPLPDHVSFEKPEQSRLLENLGESGTGAAVAVGGTPFKALQNDKNNEIYVLVKKSHGTEVAVLDEKTLRLKRKSFSGACGAGDSDFDLDSSGKFIACARGSKIELLDTGMLEWLDTAEAGLKGPSRVRFGAPGTLYVTDMRDGFLLEMHYDRYGHGLKPARKKILGRGILSLACFPEKKLVAAGNILTGEVFILKPGNLKALKHGVIDPAVKMNSLYTDPEFLLFRLFLYGLEANLRMKPEALLNADLRPAASDYGAAAFFVMPVKIWRLTR